ncbi:unnamed protein product [Adineta ricciae]|uniref:Uncharacterized protein n=1 Tax=Adineta ricciae TaxID=249248 RepID=A0A814T884_ADIRI|nr:unnamed protein product [Adineta ricciae]
MSKNTTFHTTSSESTLLYCHVNTITWGQHEFNLDHYFTDTKTLHMKSPVPFEVLTSKIDLDQVMHLSVMNVNDILTYIPLQTTMPQLRRLSILLFVYSTIKIGGEFSEYLTEELIQIFPNLQYLQCTSEINAEEIMYHCINGFRHLENASFSFSPVVQQDKRIIGIILDTTVYLSLQNGKPQGEEFSRLFYMLECWRRYVLYCDCSCLLYYKYDA